MKVLSTMLAAVLLTHACSEADKGLSSSANEEPSRDRVEGAKKQGTADQSVSVDATTPARQVPGSQDQPDGLPDDVLEQFDPKERAALRKLASEHVSLRFHMVRFEPEGYRVFTGHSGHDGYIVRDVTVIRILSPSRYKGREIRIVHRKPDSSKPFITPGRIYSARVSKLGLEFAPSPGDKGGVDEKALEGLEELGPAPE